MIGPAAAPDEPIQYVNGISVSFYGNEFIVTPFVALPDPHDTIQNKPAPNPLHGRVLGKFAITPGNWQRVLAAMNHQMNSLLQSGQVQPVPLPNLNQDA